MIKNIIKYKFAAFALAAIAAGTLASCSSVADETAPESKTVTASMDGISKPAFAPSSRTTTDISTLTSAWEKYDYIKVTFTFYSDEAGTKAIDASDCPDGTQQNLNYNGTTWGIYPESLRIPTATRSMKADYSYSKDNGSLKGNVPLTAAATTYTMYEGTETITGTSGVVVPTDITSLAITLKPLTLTRNQAAIAITGLAQGQGVSLNIGGF